MASSLLTNTGALASTVSLPGVTASNTQVFTNGTKMALRASFTHTNSGFTPFFVNVDPGESIHFVSGFTGTLSVTTARLHTAIGWDVSASSDALSGAEDALSEDGVIGPASATSGTRRAGPRVFLSLE